MFLRFSGVELDPEHWFPQVYKTICGHLGYHHIHSSPSVFIPAIVMKLQIFAVPAALISCALGFPHLANFPEYRSLAGLSQDEVRYVARKYGKYPGAQPLPPPINYTGPKLVNDADHPFKPLEPTDIRGPCPGLNTLASHGVSSQKCW